MTELTIIAAVCSNGAIGRRGELLFHLRDDLRRFKELTMGHPIIMGRKTFQSFPKGPLPGRRNIVMTRGEFSAHGIEVVHSPAEALAAVSGDTKAYIIGGEEIYRLFMPLASRLELTEIDAAPADADAYFPSYGAFAPAETGQWQGSDPRFRFITLLNDPKDLKK